MSYDSLLHAANLTSASPLTLDDEISTASIEIPLNLTCYYMPTPSLASENQLLFSRYVNGYLTGVCVIGGTIGNVMSVRSVRLSNFERNRGIRLAVAIIVLAVWDTLMLWCAIAYYGLKNFIPTPASDWAILATPFFHGLSQVTHTASVWSVLTITVQRYMATRDPFRKTRNRKNSIFSFRNLLDRPNVNAAAKAGAKTPLTSYPSSRSNSGGGNVARAASIKYHKSLFSGSTPSSVSMMHCCSQPHPQYSSVVKYAYSPTQLLRAKHSVDWKTPSNFWWRYKRHLRMPFITSVLAILVNIPAFFEIVAVPCYYFPEYRIIYKLYVSYFRLNDYYKFWYRMVFRMLVTTCGPNIFILCVTVITVLMLRGTNRSQQQLFHNNEVAIEQYSSRAKILTTISICLAVKFLLLRSLTFMLDIWEVVYGFKKEVHRYLYVVDISNFLIILNGSTNCLIIYGFSRWLHHKISTRNIEKREKQHYLNNIKKKRQTILLYKSWQNAVKLTHRQFGNRVLYAMLSKNPQMFAPFCGAENSNPYNNSTDYTENASGETKWPGKLKYWSEDACQENSQEINSCLKNISTNLVTPTSHTNKLLRRHSAIESSLALDLNKLMPKFTSNLTSSYKSGKLLRNQCQAIDEEFDLSEEAKKSPPNISNQTATDLSDADAASAETSKLLPSITVANTTLLDSEITLNAKKYEKEDGNGQQKREDYELNNNCPKMTNGSIFAGSKVRVGSAGDVTNISSAKTGLEAAATAVLCAIPKTKKQSIDMLLNARFYQFGEQIVQFFDEIIKMMQHDGYEQAVIAKMQYIGKIHHDHNVIFTASTWKEFKLSALSIFAECNYDNETERAETLEAWSSLLSIMIHNMKLGMWNGNRYSTRHNSGGNTNKHASYNNHHNKNNGTCDLKKAFTGKYNINFK